MSRLSVRTTASLIVIAETTITTPLHTGGLTRASLRCDVMAESTITRESTEREQRVRELRVNRERMGSAQ